jgi:hypothetical protein
MAYICNEDGLLPVDRDEHPALGSQDNKGLQEDGGRGVLAVLRCGMWAGAVTELRPRSPLYGLPPHPSP